MCSRTLLWICLVAATVLKQGVAQAPIISPEVHDDATVTFRYDDPNAKQVSVVVQAKGSPWKMHKDANGEWSVTTAPLEAQIYDYQFEVDGRLLLDPLNAQITPNLVQASSLFLVPGRPAMPWEVSDVAHGVVHHHWYRSAVVKGLARDESEYFVYTPPGYGKGQRYPVLYLLHGWSDSASGWSDIGRVNMILDNLIASGRVRPMVVVMPLGYGEMSFVRNGFGVWDDEDAVSRNVLLFERALLTEILPAVEKNYSVRPYASDRAIAGLSMGALESLKISLDHPELFRSAAAFSSAVRGIDFSRWFSPAAAKAGKRPSLWMICGKQDIFLPANRSLVDWFSSNQISVSYQETEGGHTWIVWRNALIAWLPSLFAGK